MYALEEYHRYDKHYNSKYEQKPYLFLNLDNLYIIKHKEIKLHHSSDHKDTEKRIKI
jgi:hypothetical protein